MHLHYTHLNFCPPKACLTVTGDDAFTFLQGQFTNQLNVPPGHVVYGLWLNQKGKVLADSFVLRIAANEFIVLSMHSSAAVIRGRLEAYIVADDVVLADDTSSQGGLAIFGTESERVVREMFAACPSDGEFLRLADGLCVFRGRRAAEANFEIVGPTEKVEECCRRLTKGGATAIDSAALERRRIEAMIPRIPEDIGLGDLPNEGGLDDVAISYSKGCYLGQEVMARLKNLGQVRRELRLVRGRGEAPGAPVTLYQGVERVGELRTVANDADGAGFVALAMLSLVKFKTGVGLSLMPDGPITLEVAAP